MNDTLHDPAPTRTGGTGLLDRYRRSRDAEAGYWRDALSTPPAKHRSRRSRRALAVAVLGGQLMGAVALFVPPLTQSFLYLAFWLGLVASIMLVTSMRDVLPRQVDGRMGLFTARAQAPDERLQAAWDRACRHTLAAGIGVGVLGGFGTMVALYLTGSTPTLTITPTLAAHFALLTMLLAITPVAILAWSDPAEPDPGAATDTGRTIVPAPPAAGRLYRLLTGLLMTGFFFAFMLLATYTQSRDWTEAVVIAGGGAIVFGLLTPWLMRSTYARRRRPAVPTPSAHEPR